MPLVTANAPRPKKWEKTTGMHTKAIPNPTPIRATAARARAGSPASTSAPAPIPSRARAAASARCGATQSPTAPIMRPPMLTRAIVPTNPIAAVSACPRSVRCRARWATAVFQGVA